MLFLSFLSLSFSADKAIPICYIKTSSVTVGSFRNERILARILSSCKPGFPKNGGKDVVCAQSHTVDICHHFHHSMQIGFVALDPRLSSEMLEDTPLGPDIENPRV